jgi:excisionase family DNA binding protein
VIEQLIRDLVAAEVARGVEPLRRDLERLRAELAGADGMVTQDEAARRLGVTRRAVQRWLRDGRLEAVPAGGVRMVRWPPTASRTGRRSTVG